MGLFNALEENLANGLVRVMGEAVLLPQHRVAETLDNVRGVTLRPATGRL